MSDARFMSMFFAVYQTRSIKKGRQPCLMGLQKQGSLEAARYLLVALLMDLKIFPYCNGMKEPLLKYELFARLLKTSVFF